MIRVPGDGSVKDEEMAKILPFRKINDDEQLPQGVCPCMGSKTEWMIYDERYFEVFGVNGPEGTLAINHPNTGLLFVHVEYCPFCGRKFNHEEGE